MWLLKISNQWKHVTNFGHILNVFSNSKLLKGIFLNFIKIKKAFIFLVYSSLLLKFSLLNYFLKLADKK